MLSLNWTVEVDDCWCSIDANIKLRADRATAELRTVDAQIGVGGTYSGVAVIKS